MPITEYICTRETLDLSLLLTQTVSLSLSREMISRDGVAALNRFHLEVQRDEREDHTFEILYDYPYPWKHTHTHIHTYMHALD